MFGPAFMVNPVTEQGDKSRKVYLPAASKWYDFWTGEKLNGGQSIDAPAPIDIMPLYIKAGSIIPMGPEMEYATQKPGDIIELRIYSGANGSFKMYEDENDTYNYEKGAKAIFILTWNDKTHQLNISDTKGNFPGMLKHHTFNVVLVGKDHGTGEAAAAKFDKVVHYSGKAISVKL